jgi:hypothetical protein
MRNLLRLSVCSILVVLCAASSSWAWLDTGHKIVAIIAWEDLTPKTRAAITDLLQKHPRYEKDLLAFAPDNATPDQLAEHAFAVAATWPDMVRKQDHPMRNLYNHPQWHYIDIPFEDGAKAPPEPQGGPGPHNVVEALTQCTAELKDASIEPDKKAIDICWVAHLVGDIHQPLHAASRYSPQFPKGDAGGNSEIVLRDPPYPDSQAKLHLIWDELPGDFSAESIDHYMAAGLRADPRYSREHFKAELGVTDFMAWAQESHQLAVTDAYLNGKLQAATAPHGGNHLAADSIPGLPEGYMDRAEKDAMREITLAGYRLADMLNSIFDPKP